MPTVRTVARIHYEIPDDLHRRAKAAAAMRGVTLKEFVITALDQAAGDDERRRGGTSPARRSPQDARRTQQGP